MCVALHICHYPILELADSSVINREIGERGNVTLSTSKFRTHAFVFKIQRQFVFARLKLNQTANLRMMLSTHVVDLRTNLFRRWKHLTLLREVVYERLYARTSSINFPSSYF